MPLDTGRKGIILTVPIADISSAVTLARGTCWLFFCCWSNCCNHSHTVESIHSINGSEIVVNIVRYILNKMSWCESWNVCGLCHCSTTYKSHDFRKGATKIHVSVMSLSGILTQSNDITEHLILPVVVLQWSEDAQLAWRPDLRG